MVGSRRKHFMFVNRVSLTGFVPRVTLELLPALSPGLSVTRDSLQSYLKDNSNEELCETLNHKAVRSFISHLRVYAYTT